MNTGFGQGGAIDISTALAVCAILVETIELSFVSVFVTFLGRKLTRQFMNHAFQGIYLAQQNMRKLVVQPGSALTQYEYSRHGVLFTFDAITIAATVVATLHTIASDARVFATFEDKDKY